jgi:hypothetical protein
MLTVLAAWRQFHGPLTAIAVTLALAGIGRFLRIELLCSAAGGVGVVAGWYVVTNRFWVSSPLPSVPALPGFATLTLVIALLCSWLASSRRRLVAMLFTALASGWFLAGAPRDGAALRASWPIAVAGILGVLLFVRILTDRAVVPLYLGLAGLTLAAGLHIAGASPFWTQLALVPGVAAFAMLILPSTDAQTALPVIVGTAVLAALAALATGRLSRLAFAPTDAAALSPLLAIWLAPRAAERMRSAGRAAPLASSLIAGVIAVGCVWLARRLLRH